MEKNNHLSLLIFLLLTIFSHQLSAQLNVPFKVRHQSFVKGDMTIIANNIVNRKDSFVKAVAPYNSTDYSAKHNDELNMEYIDIDNDNSTFSSSNANFSTEKTANLKVVYAGLYWSATYKYNIGKQKRNRKYVAVDKDRDAFDVVKLKLPRQEKYINIKGEILFDGLNENGFEENAPYAVYADVTKLLSDLQNPQGNYTVANVRATNGTLSGGVSAGWTMIIVYEDKQETGKFITTYDGFTGVSKESSDIDFNGFQTLPEGKVNLKIAGAGLEGDLGLKGDQISFKSAENEDFTILNTKVRDFNNFFNSSITINDEVFAKRFPNSQNTLGYDSFLMTVYNPDNQVIGNNTTEAKLRFKSTGDRYFMFFSAFSVEVLETAKAIDEIKPNELLVENKTLPTATNTTSLSNAVALNETTENTIQKEEVKEVTQYKITATKEKEEKSQTTTKTNDNVVATKTVKTTTKKADKIRVTPIESKSRSFPGEEKGYYIIANVFAKHSNATRFVSKLQSLGIEAGYFINQANNYRYVYVSHHENFSEAQTLYFSNINEKYFGDLWIMTVNKENDKIVKNKIENTTFAKDKDVALTIKNTTIKKLIKSSLSFFEESLNYICHFKQKES